MDGYFAHIEDPAWLDLISRVPSDSYHLPGYLDACQLTGNDEIRVAIVVHDGIVTGVPLQIRPLPYETDGFDAFSPYGYPCILSTAESEAQWRTAFGSLIRFLQSENLIAVFLRAHPLLTTDSCLQACESLGAPVYHGQTVYIPLSQSLDEIWKNTRRDHRSSINKLTAGGWSFVADNWEYFEDFLQMYEQTMSRLMASKSYLFGREYYDRLRRGLGDTVKLHTVLDPEGIPAAAGLFFQRNEIVQYHLASVSERHFSASPNKLVVLGAVRFYKERGAGLFHLGGGVGAADDRLFYFKSGFSKHFARFYTLRFIIDRSRYDALSAIHQAQHSMVIDTDLSGFFPVYRAPLQLESSVQSGVKAG
jgi:hypothetical protein